MFIKFRWMITMISAFSLFGCVVATPLRGPGYEPGKGITINGIETVYIGMTHAVLREDRNLRSTFWLHVKKVEASLKDRPGFVCYSKRTRLLGNDAWTMTVWTDEASLENFVLSRVHQRAIRESMGALESAAFARFELNKAEFPLPWKRAIELLDQHNRKYG